MSRSLLLSIVVLAVAALVGACGGDDDSNASGESGGELTSSSLSREEYTQQANALCNRSKQKLLKEIASYTPSLVKENPGKTIPAARNFPETFRVVIMPAIQRQVNALGQLGIPSDEGDQAEQVVTSMQEAVDDVKTNPPASDAEFLRTFEAASDLAREYGIDACAFG